MLRAVSPRPSAGTATDTPPTSTPVSAAAIAVSTAQCAEYDVPYRITGAPAHDRLATHCRVASPSAPSFSNGRKRPRDRCRPRTSWVTTAIPRRTHSCASAR